MNTASTDNGLIRYPAFAELAHAIHTHNERTAVLPRYDALCLFVEGAFRALFPYFFDDAPRDPARNIRLLEDLHAALLRMLAPLDGCSECNASSVAASFFEHLPAAYELMWSDARAIVENDPAAHSIDDVILSYPGFWATAVYRLARIFHHLEVPFAPRMLTEYAHRKTGIDIHPGANIGASFCVDHGTGVVIGETTVIGSHVKIYQGVTLGALSVSKSLASTKRHPTIEDHCVVYSNATILGGDTVVGHHSVIGGNVWLTSSVPPHSKIYHSR